MTLQTCGFVHRCAAWSMCERERDFYGFSLCQQRFCSAVWCGQCVNGKQFSSFTNDLIFRQCLDLDETKRFYSVQNLEICLAKESYANRKWPKEGSCSSPSSIVSPYFKPTSIHLMTMKLAMRLLLVLPHRLFLDIRNWFL